MSLRGRRHRRLAALSSVSRPRAWLTSAITENEIVDKPADADGHAGHLATLTRTPCFASWPIVRLHPGPPIRVAHRANPMAGLSSNDTDRQLTVDWFAVHAGTPPPRSASAGRA